MQWSTNTVNALYDLAFNELLFKAQQIHRNNFPENEMELCSLLSIKTGACPEDCAYCPQSGHYQTGVAREKLLDMEKIVSQAIQVKQQGATRFCMGAAWRSPPKKDFPKILAIIKAVKKLGLETCVTLGMLTEEKAIALKEAGLDYYNHNLDTSPNYYKKIITTRTYQDRLKTLKHVQNANIHICCGGILGMGESRVDRIELLLQLSNLPTAPKSVPINCLIRAQGTPLENAPALDSFEFIRTIAVARILLPNAVIRLSAGRAQMTEEMQALCFLAGANSMWLGDKLLTRENPAVEKDKAMIQKLGMKIKKVST